MAAGFRIGSDVEVDDFVMGCAFYGTGGGGSPKYGADIMRRVLSEGKSVSAVDASLVPDDAWTVCAYGMGSIAPRTSGVLREMKSLGLSRVRVTYKLAEAIRELEQYTKIKIDAIVPLR